METVTLNEFIYRQYLVDNPIKTKRLPRKQKKIFKRKGIYNEFKRYCKNPY
jgi:hypothetical protein